MKNYFAGIPGAPEQTEIKLDNLQRLLSLFDILNFKNGGRLKNIWEVKKTRMGKKHKIDLFLDSGAFSAFTQKIEIDIYEYIKFIKENKKYINVYANLDVIGDAVGTLKNQKIMEKAGLHPIPCFHFKEDFSYLENYVDNYEYIALGGVAQAGRKVTEWMDLCFDVICGKNGKPKTKVHGFAVTSLRLMLRYPWYSVDSTSWVTTGRMGSVYIPKMRRGEYIYDENSWKIAVSSKSPSRKQKGQHILNMSRNQRKMCLKYFKSKGFRLGKSKFREEDPDKYVPLDNEKWNKKKEGIIETIIKTGLCNDYRQRDELNIVYFMDLEKFIPGYPHPLWQNKQNTRLF